MLAAEDAGAYASEPHHVADPHRDVRGVVPRLLRSLHGEIPVAGRRAAHLDQARGCGDPRQWAHDDARKKQHGNRGGDGAVAWRSTAGFINEVALMLSRREMLITPVAMMVATR